MNAARWKMVSKCVCWDCQRRCLPLAAHSIVRALASVLLRFFFDVQSGGQSRKILIVVKQVTRAIVSEEPANGDS